MHTYLKLVLDNGPLTFVYPKDFFSFYKFGFDAYAASLGYKLNIYETKWRQGD